MSDKTRNNDQMSDKTPTDRDKKSRVSCGVPCGVSCGVSCVDSPCHLALSQQQASLVKMGKEKRGKREKSRKKEKRSSRSHSPNRSRARRESRSRSRSREGNLPVDGIMAYLQSDIAVPTGIDVHKEQHLETTTQANTRKKKKPVARAEESDSDLYFTLLYIKSDGTFKMFPGTNHI
jgi:hypothetical protein